MYKCMYRKRKKNAKRYRVVSYTDVSSTSRCVYKSLAMHCSLLEVVPLQESISLQANQPDIHTHTAKHVSCVSSTKSVLPRSWNFQFLLLNCAKRSCQRPKPKLRRPHFGSIRMFTQKHTM